MLRAASLTVLFAGAAFAHPPPGMGAPRSAPPRAPITLGDGARLDEIQGAIAEARLDGWLLTDFRGEDDVAVELVHPRGAPSRRWFYLIPATGEPTALMARAEAASFDAVPGRKASYETWRDVDGKLRDLLRGRKKVAMAYAPRGQLPTASRVDGGTLELVRATGVTVVPSGDLVTRFLARWSEPQRASHFFAMHQLVALKDEAWKAIADAAAKKTRITEHDVQQLLARGLKNRGLETEVPPLVAAGAHTAEPGYRPGAQSSEIRPGDLVVVELAARQASVPGAVYADGTWVGCVGEPPARAQAAFRAVKAARDQAVALLRERAEKKAALAGWEVDAAARASLAKAGFGGNLLHAVGHSLDRHRFGDGPDLDDTDAHDDRALVPRTGYVVAPGLYFPGELGVRSAVDVYYGDGAIELSADQPQQEIEAIGAPPPPPPPTAASAPTVPAAATEPPRKQ